MNKKIEKNKKNENFSKIVKKTLIIGILQDPPIHNTMIYLLLPAIPYMYSHVSSRLKIITHPYCGRKSPPFSDIRLLKNLFFQWSLFLEQKQYLLE